MVPKMDLLAISKHFKWCVFVIIGLIINIDNAENIHVDENGEQAVISLLSKLLLNRQPQRNNTRPNNKYIKNMKIELTYEIDPNWLNGNLPVLFEVKDREMEELRRKKRSVKDSDKNDDLDLALRIPAQYIVVVKLGIPVNKLNQSGVLQLRSAFATELNLPIENVNIDKIRYHGNDIEMFFVRAGSEPLLFSLDDLIPSENVVQGDLVENVKKKVPALNITTIYMQQEVIFTSHPQPFWMQVSFRYIMAGCGALVFILTAALILTDNQLRKQLLLMAIGYLGQLLPAETWNSMHMYAIYCCCKKKEKTLKETDDEIRASQQIYYPTVTPDTKNPLRIQPGNDEVYIPKGSLTPVPTQPVRQFKAKGLLERRGSSASLKINLNPTQQVNRWEGTTPPKECTGLEYLLSAGNRLSRRDLKNAVKHPRILHQEFWEIPMNHPEKIYVAGSGMKNRYRTIIPNEHSRVILPDSEWDPLSSYINANFIRGYEGEPHAYIATQGPLPHSIVDFWHMIWNEKAPIIVMITKLKEKNKTKCENYLPEDYSVATFGDIEVKVEKTVYRNGYTIRNLVLKCNGECQYALHYWYTAWPDHKPPESPDKIIELVKEVEQRRYSENSLRVRGPVVVHCSAGIGRTGCFISISVGMRQLREEHSVDVLGTVCSMRIDRGGMIQTHEQYSFVHQALSQYEKELAAEPPSAFVPD